MGRFSGFLRNLESRARGKSPDSSTGDIYGLRGVIRHIRSEDQISVWLYVLWKGAEHKRREHKQCFFKRQWPWPSLFPSLNFSFFIYKMELMLIFVLPTSQSCMRFRCENRNESTLGAAALKHIRATDLQRLTFRSSQVQEQCFFGHKPGGLW